MTSDVISLQRRGARPTVAVAVGDVLHWKVVEIALKMKLVAYTT